MFQLSMVSGKFINDAGSAEITIARRADAFLQPVAARMCRETEAIGEKSHLSGVPMSFELPQQGGWAAQGRVSWFPAFSLVSLVSRYVSYGVAVSAWGGRGGKYARCRFTVTSVWSHKTHTTLLMSTVILPSYANECAAC